jgi:hypothetical protein
MSFDSKHKPPELHLHLEESDLNAFRFGALLDRLREVSDMPIKLIIGMVRFW